jgi:hypothetical protein
MDPQAALFVPVPPQRDSCLSHLTPSMVAMPDLAQDDLPQTMQPSPSGVVGLSCAVHQPGTLSPVIKG